jgi:outer membrane lipoprotein SlyB
MGRNIATVLGAGVGAFAGKEIEKQVNTKKRWDITVRMDNGSMQTVSSNTEPFWHAGDRVRLVDGRLQPV